MTSTSVSSSELAALIAGLGGRQPAAAVPAQPPAADPRCEVTELLASQCAHCRPAPPAEQADTGLGPWFTSTYRGRCAGCGVSFDEFTEIRAGDGGWLARCCGHAAETNHVDPLDGLIAPAATPIVPAGYVPFEKCTCPGDDDGIGHSHGCKHWPNQMPAAQAPAAISRPAGPPASTIKELRQVLIDFEASRPRSMQVALGPSELGTPCQQQIARKIAGAPRRPITDPTWAPFQGTAVHRSMEDVVAFWNAQLGRERWLAEDRLVVDPGLPGDDGVYRDGISGNGDAFDLDWGMVVDWKHTGKTARDKLARAKRMGKPPAEQVSPEYRAQGHLYGLGHQRKGRYVRYVRLVLLARSHDYDESEEWTEPFDPEIALRALDRYWSTRDLLNALNVTATPDLVAAVAPTPSRDGCKWCPFLRPGKPADWGGCPGDKPIDTFVARASAGLIA